MAAIIVIKDAFDYYNIYLCGKCKRDIEPYSHARYCPHCGSYLGDWSDVDDRTSK